MAFEFKPVLSSQFKAVQYDPANLKLRIKFNNDQVYEYDDVPSTIHEELMKSESKGSFFGQKIKNGGFTFRKILEYKDKK